MPFFAPLLRGRSLACASVLVLSSLAHAGTINVVNGNFSQTNATSSSQFGNNYSSVQLTGWTGTGYEYIFMPASGTTSGTQADNSGAKGQYGTLKLWGPGDGSANGLTNSPDGGNFVGLDGVFEAPTTISQTLSGLTVGAATTVSFYYAGAQQYGYTGNSTEYLDVSLGNQTQTTTILADGSHGFTGWQAASFTFMPTSTSATLSFLAHGTPNGEPPFTLLDGVSVSNTVTPEPSSLALFGTGLMSAAGLMRRKFRKA